MNLTLINLRKKKISSLSIIKIQFIWAKSLIREKDMDKDFNFIITAEFTRGIGFGIKDMDEDTKGSQMGIHTKGNIIKVRLTEKDFSLGEMEKNMMENGR
jgi:hypothetical protein